MGISPRRSSATPLAIGSRTQQRSARHQPLQSGKSLEIPFETHPSQALHGHGKRQHRGVNGRSQLQVAGLHQLVEQRPAVAAWEGQTAPG